MKLIISRGPNPHTLLPSANHRWTILLRSMPLQAFNFQERSDSSQIHLAVLCDRLERGHALQIQGRPKVASLRAQPRRLMASQRRTSSYDIRVDFQTTLLARIWWTDCLCLYMRLVRLAELSFTRLPLRPGGRRWPEPLSYVDNDTTLHGQIRDTTAAGKEGWNLQASLSGFALRSAVKNPMGYSRLD